MPNIDIYTKDYCPYCQRALALLKAKNVVFNQIKIDEKPKMRAPMIERANGRSTVPQIFVGKTHVGGCDDLMMLERDGELDALLEI
jgi:glutaredoxin 3